MVAFAARAENEKEVARGAHWVAVDGQRYWCMSRFIDVNWESTVPYRTVR